MMIRGAALLACAFLAAAAAPASHKVVRNSTVLEFSFKWPAQAVAIPQLDLHFYTEAKAELARSEKWAAEDRALARRQKRRLNPHYYSAGWESVGETPRLLSLQGAIETFQGGAHPNHDFQALLWDRALNRKLPVTALFVRPFGLTTVARAAYCRALDLERKKRRQGEPPSDMPGPDPFSDCPKLSELAIAPADPDRNGKFEKIHFIAPPYVAGPYVEGEYSVVLPVTRALIGALKPEYRGSFEVQRQTSGTGAGWPGPTRRHTPSRSM